MSDLHGAWNWIIGVFTALIAAVWGDMKIKLHQIESRLEKKADNYELERARDTQKDIFEKIEVHDAQDRERHTTLLLQIGELKGMMNTLLSRKRGGE